MEYIKTSEPCPICTAEAKEKSDALLQRTQQRLQEKLENISLYKMLAPIQTDSSSRKITPIKVSRPKKMGCYYFLSLQWAEAWKSYIDDPSQEVSDLKTLQIDNKQNLLCLEHNKLLFDPNLLFDNPNNTLFLVLQESEWKVLHSRYGGGPEIVYNVVCDTGEGITEPPLCSECIKRKEEKDYLEKLNFENGTLYVVFELNASDPRYRVKSKRLMRKNKITGLKCTDTIGHLKLLLFAQFDIPPNEQVLYYNNTLLDKNDKVLQEYKILPETTITLVRVEPNEFDFDEQMKIQTEEGFKGTSLVFFRSQEKNRKCR